MDARCIIIICPTTPVLQVHIDAIIVLGTRAGSVNEVLESCDFDLDRFVLCEHVLEGADVIDVAWSGVALYATPRGWGVLPGAAGGAGAGVGVAVSA